MEFKYIPFNIENKEQNKLVEELRKDNPGYTFLSLKNNLFLVQLEQKMIGAIAVNTRSYLKDSLAIDIAISKEEQNKNYGSRVLENFSDYLLDSDYCNTVILEISLLNIPSIKAAINAGYSVDEEVLETFRKEDYRYVPYSKKRNIKVK